MGPWIRKDRSVVNFSGSNDDWSDRAKRESDMFYYLYKNIKKRQAVSSQRELTALPTFP
jgi:hypothetical protein